MIKCLLTEFGGASGENIKLRVMKKGPRCAPTTPSISTQYFGFVRHTFITHDVIEHEKWKVLFFFQQEMSGFSVYSFERFDFHHKIDHSTT